MMVGDLLVNMYLGKIVLTGARTRDVNMKLDLEELHQLQKKSYGLGMVNWFMGGGWQKKNVAWKEIASQSEHVISFLYLCGHEKYLNFTMYGISVLLPHYGCIFNGTNMGAQRKTKEHLGIVIS